ncbi:MAG: succinylglutamate desuccinylase/aspartoacylase family protein [Planctomycetota bacterium]
MDQRSTTEDPAIQEAPATSAGATTTEQPDPWVLGLERVLAEIDQGRPGPTVLVQGGIHGNEPGGVHALQRILRDLEERDVEIHGRLVACVGNLRALRSKLRYLAGDLNRRWLPGVVDRLAAQDPQLDDPEDQEQRELLELYQRLDAERSGPMVFLDLHSSSADGPPFTCMADTIPNRRVADQIPNPMILGLEECIDGAVMDWFNRRGQIAIAFEGGQHDAPETIDNLEACTWLALAAVGVLAQKDVDIAKHRRHLKHVSRGTSHLIAVQKRHAIRPEDRFVMVPGYVNFQPIEKGELLAQDATGEVRAERSGMVLLPLYQGQGNDGFFFAREVPRFWFRLSIYLRRLRLGHLLHWLPGVNRDNGDPHSLIVDPRIARFWVVQVFHLFGFRRERARSDGLLSFSRRRARSESWTVRPRR